MESVVSSNHSAITEHHHHRHLHHTNLLFQTAGFGQTQYNRSPHFQHHKPYQQSVSSLSNFTDTGSSFHFKAMVVGEPGVGKTTLIETFHGRRRVFHVPKTADPIVEDMWLQKSDANMKKYTCAVYDINADEEYSHLRGQTYGEDTDVFLVCFSLVDRQSFDAVRDKWVPEIRRHCQRPLILLVGLKRDERETCLDANFVIELEEGHRMARSLDAVGYIECSSLGGVKSWQLKLADCDETGVEISRSYSNQFRRHFITNRSTLPARRRDANDDDDDDDVDAIAAGTGYRNDGPHSVGQVFEMCFQSCMQHQQPAKKHQRQHKSHGSRGVRDSPTAGIRVPSTWLITDDLEKMGVLEVKRKEKPRKISRRHRNDQSQAKCCIQ